MNINDILLSKWFVLETPLGYGTAIVAGGPEPDNGIIVCKAECVDFNPFNPNTGRGTISIMKHIVELHNEWLPRLRIAKEGGHDEKTLQKI